MYKMTRHGLGTVELVGSGWRQLRRLRMRVGTRDAPPLRAGHRLAGHHGGQLGVQHLGGLSLSPRFLF